MKQKVKIVSCFNVTGIGIITEIQHLLNGLIPFTKLYNPSTKEIWVVLKRVFDSNLTEKEEIKFENETEFSIIMPRFENPEKLKSHIKQEIKKRKNGIYWYIIKPDSKQGKPQEGVELEIIEN